MSMVVYYALCTTIYCIFKFINYHYLSYIFIFILAVIHKFNYVFYLSIYFTSYYYKPK